jgi:hypothetical protein
VISGFRRDVDDTRTRLGYYATSSGNPLPTFRDNVSVPSSTVKKPLKMGPIQEDRRSQGRARVRQMSDCQFFSKCPRVVLD